MSFRFKEGSTDKMLLSMRYSPVVCLRGFFGVPADSSRSGTELCELEGSKESCEPSSFWIPDEKVLLLPMCSKALTDDGDG